MDMVNTDAFKEVAQSYGLSQTDWKIVMENLASLRPIDLALQFFSMDVFMGFFVSIPVAMIMARSPKRMNKTDINRQ